MDKLTEKLSEIKEALAASTPDWYDNGNEIVSKQNPMVGIGGFLKEEDNHLAGNAQAYITYLLQLVETQAKALDDKESEIAHLANALEDMTSERNIWRSNSTY